MKPAIYSKRVWFIVAAAGLCAKLVFQQGLLTVLRSLSDTSNAQNGILLCLVLGGLWLTARGLARFFARAERGAEQEQRNRLAERLATAVEHGDPQGGQIQPFALYLRPFALERSLQGRVHRAGSEEMSFLESGAVAFDRFLQEHLDYLDLPLISIGIDRLREGAGNVPTTDEEWLDLFRKLAGHATAIFVVPGMSNGILEEVHWLKENGLLAKTVFFKPAGYSRAAWQKLRVFHEGEKGMEFPEYSAKQVSFRLGSAGGCQDVQTWPVVSDKQAMKRSVGQMRALLAGVSADKTLPR
jgi:hypothetical protein